MVTASLRHGVTIAGAVLLVTGTLCLLGGAMGEMGAAAPSSDPRAMPHEETELMTSSSSSNAVLRSISFFVVELVGSFFCLDSFGQPMLESFPGIISTIFPGIFITPQSSLLKKQTCSTWETTNIPTYEEALNCQPAENALSYIQSQIAKEHRLPLYQVVDEHNGDSRRRSSSDSVLFRNIPSKPVSASQDEAKIVCDTPPPSYESIGLGDG